MQLEFMLKDQSPVESKFEFVEKQVNEIRLSSERVRKSMYAQLNELKKLCYLQKAEIEKLKHEYEKYGFQKREWVYGQEDDLFTLREA